MFEFKLRRDGARRLALLGACSICVGLISAGCSHHASETGPSLAPQSAAPASPVQQGATNPRPATNSAVVVYKLAESGQGSGGGDGLVARAIALPSGSDSPARAAVTNLTEGSDSPLPHGTRILGLKIDSGTKLATVDFSSQFKSNFEGGDTREAEAVNSVLETLGQFPDVQKVQFLVEGKKIDSLGGTQELDEPLPTPQSSQQLASNASGGA